MSSRSRERYFPFILPVIFYHTHRRKQPFSINIRACAYATLCKACSSQWLLFQNIKFYIVLRETGRGEKDERAPTGWLFGCTEPGVKSEKSHRCAHSHAPALCRSQQHRHCFNMWKGNQLCVEGELKNFMKKKKYVHVGVFQIIYTLSLRFDIQMWSENRRQNGSARRQHTATTQEKTATRQSMKRRGKGVFFLPF